MFKAKLPLNLTKYFASLAMIGILLHASGAAERIGEIPSAADLIWILLAAACSLLIITLRAVRWNMTVARLGHAIPSGALIRIYGSAFFFGAVTPGRLGELMKVWLARDYFSSPLDATASVLLDRIFDVLPGMVMTIILVSVIAVAGPGRAATCLPAAIIGGLVAVVAVSLGSGAFIRTTGRIVAKGSRILGLKTQTALSAAQVFDRPLVLRLMVLSLVSQLLMVLQAYLISRCAGGTIDAWTGYGAVVVGNAAAALPISIGGFGVRELTAVGILMGCGFGRDAAARFAIAALASNAFVAALTAIPFMLAGPSAAQRRSLSGKG